jgi:hypothetical protein
MIQEF